MNYKILGMLIIIITFVMLLGYIHALNSDLKSVADDISEKSEDIVIMKGELVIASSFIYNYCNESEFNEYRDYCLDANYSFHTV